MNISELINPLTLTAIVVGIIIGTIGASIRAIVLKESPKEFFWRVLSGAMLGGVVNYAIRDSGIADILKIPLLFGCGFAVAEYAKRFANIGRKAYPGGDMPENENTNSNKNES